MPVRFGGPGVTNTLADLTSNQFALAAGAVWNPPANGYWAVLGANSHLQEFDPVTTLWQPAVGSGSESVFFSADGANQRIANTTGTVTSVTITDAGTGYITPPVVTASAGGAKFTAIIGGTVGSITVTFGGSNYTKAPIVFIAAPPSPGIPATAVATISAGVVTGVTIENAGAGYTFPPQVIFVNDPRDTTGANASAAAALTGTGTVTGIVVIDNGTPLGSAPTLTFTGGGGSAAAGTAVLNGTGTTDASNYIFPS